MTLHARPLVAVLALLAGAGCHAELRRALGEDRAVESGLPVGFGFEEAPEREWDFGDGAPRVTGRKVRHAFARPGSFTVRAFEGGRTVGQVVLVAVPRRVTRAAPALASSLVYLPRMRGNVEQAVDFAERAVGAAAAQRALMDGVVSDTLLELVAAQPGLDGPLDLDEGLGVFAVPGAGSALCFGVTEGDKAISRFAERFIAHGATGHLQQDGSYWLSLSAGRTAVLFEDRGYLFISSSAEGDESSVMMRVVREAPEDGMEGTSLWQHAAHELSPGNVQVLLPAPAGATGSFRGVVASVMLSAQEATLEGYLDASGPLWAPSAAPATATLLQRKPAHPLAAAYLQGTPGAIAEFFVGAQGGALREGFLAKNRLPPEAFNAFLDALTGELAVLAYFDPEGFYANLVRGSERPEPRGTLVVELGVKARAPVERMVTHALASAGLRAEPVSAGDKQTRWRTRFLGQGVEISLADALLTVTAGDPVKARDAVPLHAGLTGRFGSGAFGPGQLSAMVDFGQFIRELEAPRQIPGVDSEQLVSMQAFSTSFFKGLTPLDFGYVEVSPLPRGGRIRARVQLRAK